MTRPPRIDGRLEDDVYRDVPSFEGFIQADPKEGEPVSERTEAWVLFDDQNLYVTFRCWDTHADSIVATEMRRDNIRMNSNDHAAVNLDTFYDGRNGVHFNVSAAGGLRDGAIVNEVFQADWNVVYEARTSIDEQGWTAEYAIPFKTLRYAPGRQQTWHIQLRRAIRSAGRNEMSYLTPLKAVFGISAANKFSLAATLVGLEVPPPALNLEVKPYVISPITTDLQASPRVRNDFAPKGGLDVKYGLTKSLTADFTYNTDFAQVEIDEAQINLTRFNLTFPEKREFFLEGAGFYDLGAQAGQNAVPSVDAPTLFYSRRIGLSGSRVVPVIGGGRLNGRAGPWTISAFDIETDNDVASRAVRTNFAVARMRRNLLKRSNFGGLVTRRSVATVDSGESDTAGLDLNLAFFESVYVASYVAKTWTQSLAGDDYALRTYFNYAADRYGVQLDRQVVQPNFNPEVGFMRRTDFRRNFAELRFSPRPKNHRYVRKLTYRANLDYVTDNRNVLESRDLQGIFTLDFHSSDSLTVNQSRTFELLPSPFQIAPGVQIPRGGYTFDNTTISYIAGGQRGVSGTASLQLGTFYSGRKETAEYRGRIDLTSRLGVEPIVSLNWIDLPQRSFTTRIVGGRGVYTVNPRMFATALIQHSSSNHGLSTNLRLRWEYRPGSELFIVYSEGRSTLPPQPAIDQLQNRAFVIKMNRLIRF